jgi:hypothetical protein
MLLNFISHFNILCNVYRFSFYTKLYSQDLVTIYLTVINYIIHTYNYFLNIYFIILIQWSLDLFIILLSNIFWYKGNVMNVVTQNKIHSINHTSAQMKDWIK